MEIKEVKFLRSVVEKNEEFSPTRNDDKYKEILFLWRSNVWKSSLISSILWKNGLAYSSSKAWKTRTINLFEVNKKFICADFPWYWYARWWKEDREWLRDMILWYLSAKTSANSRIVILIDSVVWPTKDDIEVHDYIRSIWCEFVVIMSKIDKANQKQIQETKNKITITFADAKIIPYSSKDLRYRKNAIDEIFKK